MLKSLIVALAVGLSGLIGASSARALCVRPAAAPASAAVAPAAGAPAVANRSYWSYSYQPGLQANRSYRVPMARGFGSTPSLDAARKVRGF